MLQGFPTYVGLLCLPWQKTSPIETISFRGFLSDPKSDPAGQLKKVRQSPRSPYLLIGSELASSRTSSPHNFAKAGRPKPPKAPRRCHGEACSLQVNQGWAEGQTLRSECTAAKPVKAVGKGQAGSTSGGQMGRLFPKYRQSGPPTSRMQFSPRTPSAGVEGERSQQIGKGSSSRLAGLCTEVNSGEGRAAAGLPPPPLRP